MAEVLPTALDPLHKLGERRVHTSVRPEHVGRTHAPRGWDGGGTSRPHPRTHRWCRGWRPTLEQAVPFRDARPFPLPFERTQVPPVWQVSSVLVSVLTIVVTTTC